VLTKAKAFWDQHIVAGVPPAARGLDDVRLIYPEPSPEHCLEADASLHAQLEHYRSLQASISELEAQAECVKGQILTAMGKAETLRYCGQVLATWKQSRASQRIDLEALQAAHRELVAGFKRTVPGSRRFLLKAPGPRDASMSIQGARTQSLMAAHTHEAHPLGAL
jgi:predicted phage-related endonuclease